MVLFMCLLSGIVYTLNHAPSTVVSSIYTHRDLIVLINFLFALTQHLRRSNLKQKDLLWLMTLGHTVCHGGRHADRNVRQLLPLHLQSRSKER